MPSSAAGPRPAPGLIARTVGRLPPTSFFLTSAVFHYLGPSLAVLLFVHVDVLGVAWLRIASAAVVFAVWRRPWRVLRTADRSQRLVFLGLGVVLAAMNSLFYLAVDRLPLSTVGAIEFLGTVILAAAGARTRRNVLALLLAIGGVFILTVVRLSSQPLGFAFAFANCAGFMLYVILGHRIANAAVGGSGSAASLMSGIDQLGLAMLIAAVVATPLGIGPAALAFTHPVWLLCGIGVGLCSSVIPYVTDQLAMARLPRASFALMLALLPAAATVIGLIVLGQVPTVKDIAGIGLVILGVAIHRDPPQRGDEPGPPSTYREGNRMQYVNLGGCGLKVSRIGLGMMSYGNPAAQEWALDAGRAEPIVRQAVEAGVTFFDTADMYSDGASEEITGRLLGKFFPRRDDFVLATKVYYPMGPGANDRGLSRKHILASIDSSLRRLGTDHVDLYQIHRWDGETPIEETMSALHDVVIAGKARYIGASAMLTWQFAKAQYTAQIGGWTRFVSMQNRYNLVNREDEREMIPFCLDQRIGIVPYSPLARGLLAGTRERTGSQRTARSRAGDSPFRPADFDVADAVAAVASQRGLPPAQIALAWLLGRPGVSAPIVGATKPGHLLDATKALDVRLSNDEIAQLGSRYLPRAV